MSADMYVARPKMSQCKISRPMSQMFWRCNDADADAGDYNDDDWQ